MRKSFKFYVAIWAVMLIIFNAVCFLSESLRASMLASGGSFWVGYALILLCFIAQLICAFEAFKESNSRKFFLKLPLVTISYSATVLSYVLGGIFLLIPFFRIWYALVVCLVILGINAVALLKAALLAELVDKTDEKVAAKTAFIRTLTAKAEVLMNSAADDEMKAELKKVYEAIRYSDPMSHEALQDAETEMEGLFRAVCDAVTAGNAERVKEDTAKLLQVTAQRNAQCKVLK